VEYEYYCAVRHLSADRQVGGLCITLLELVAGLIINVWLKLDVWDYSDAPLNILGQITPLYTLYWTGLTLAGIFIDDFLRWKIYGEQKPIYYLNICKLFK
jgi:hypothetical protein